MAASTTQPLWGGAITTAIPSNLVDASRFRQVPDTQEVFLVASENTSDYTQMHKDDTLIFDLLERVGGSDEDAVKEHFADIAHLNDAEQWQLVSLDSTPNSITPKATSFIGVGLEPAKKWGRDEKVEGSEFKPALVVVLGVLRLANVETDLLVTYNVPISSATELEGLHKISQSGAVTTDDNVAEKRIKLAVGVVKSILETMKVQDWHLFG